jgi:hypothetical protein
MGASVPTFRLTVVSQEGVGMIRLMGSVLLFGLLAVLFGTGESSAQSMKKRAGPVMDLDGFKSQGFDYWKAPEKEKFEKPILGKFSLPKGKDYKEDGDILITELGTTDGPKEVFEGLKKQMKPPDGQKLDDLTTENEVKKEGPKITSMTIRNGTFSEGAKGKEVKEARLFAAIVETKDKKYLVRVIGPRLMISIAQPDVETFLKDLKK